MDGHVLINIDGHCFAGSFCGFKDDRIYLKQSEKSEIIVNMPLDSCAYIIDIAGNVYSSSTQMLQLKEQLNTTLLDLEG